MAGNNTSMIDSSLASGLCFVTFSHEHQLTLRMRELEIPTAVAPPVAAPSTTGTTAPLFNISKPCPSLSGEGGR